jgi:uncharacterized membrane protein YdbT with pleckstrin-like domain
MNQKIWKKVLTSNEEVKYEFSIGKRYQVLGVIVGFLIGLPFLFFPPFATAFGVLIILSFLFYFGWYLKIANVYAFTNKRVLIHKGWINTVLISIDYDKITDIKVVEPFLDRILTKTGYLSIDTAGTSTEEVVLAHLESPYEIKKKLDEIREQSKTI